MLKLSNKISKLGDSDILILPMQNYETRIAIHNYLDVDYASIFHVGLYCNAFQSNDTLVYIKCYECGFKWALLDYINDEIYGCYYHGNCVKCGKAQSFDPQMGGGDEFNIRYINPHNVIAIGNYFKPYLKHIKHIKHVNMINIENILKEVNMIKIKEPSRSIKRSHFDRYIQSQI